VETLLVEVHGMRCEGCERTVSQAVAALAGVERASADLVAEEVEVVCRAGVSAEAVQAAVAAAGFRPGAARRA
jgi:copper chaperone